MGWLGLGADVRLRPDAVGKAASLPVIAAVCSLVAAAAADRAVAADWPDALRGSLTPTYARWDGWQFGIQAGLANMNTDFGNSTSGMVAFILQNTTVESEFAPSNWAALSANGTNGQAYGAFLSYNMQWERLVLGAELVYNNTATTLEAGAASSIARQFDTSDGFHNVVSIDAQSTIKLIDYAMLRGRAGYAVGQFLPYATVGFVLGRFNFATTATVFQQGDNASTGATYGPTTTTQTVGKDNDFVGGLAAGLGVDWAITPGIFLRGEWQYIAFGPVAGIRTNINTGQLGVGARF
ncbi:MAG TPA: outer membrane beta-barrel protein [Pseudolabrys sp.]|nr:outer membrane beta-barrel protein [Pseudolabrys sp.]